MRTVFHYRHKFALQFLSFVEKREDLSYVFFNGVAVLKASP